MLKMSNTEGLLRMHLDTARNKNMKLHAIIRENRLQLKQIKKKIDWMLDIKIERYR